jgi:hypothetical protein
VKRPGLLSVPELARATGLTYRQIDYWTQKGWIEPVSQQTQDGRTLTGSGAYRWYAADLVPRLRAARNLASLWNDPAARDELLRAVIAGRTVLSAPGIRVLVDGEAFADA